MSNYAESSALFGLDHYDTEYGIDHFETLVEGRHESDASYLNNHATTVGVDSARTCGYTIPFSTALSANKSVFLTDGVKTLKVIDGKFTRNPIDLLTDDTLRK